MVSSIILRIGCRLGLLVPHTSLELPRFLTIELRSPLTINSRPFVIITRYSSTIIFTIARKDPCVFFDRYRYSRVSEKPTSFGVSNIIRNSGIERNSLESAIVYVRPSNKSKTREIWEARLAESCSEHKRMSYDPFTIVFLISLY